MYTKFSSIINELHYLAEPIHACNQVRKILIILLKSWARKVYAITESKDLKVLTMDALICNLETHMLNRENDPFKKDKSLALKITQDEESKEDEDHMAYLTGRSQKILRKHGGIRMKGNPSKAATANDLCHKYGKPGYFI